MSLAVNIDAKKRAENPLTHSHRVRQGRTAHYTGHSGILGQQVGFHAGEKKIKIQKLMNSNLALIHENVQSKNVTWTQTQLLVFRCQWLDSNSPFAHEILSFQQSHQLKEKEKKKKVDLGVSSQS